ncbi:MAG: hypothetical protein AAF995_01080 [Planctomycetota bacterium]
MSADRVTTALNAYSLDELRAGLGEFAAGSGASNPDALVAEVVGWIGGLRDQLVTLVTTIEDPDEIETTLAINYVELKSKWIALNTKINYTVFRSGACDPVDALRATGVSTLLMIVEELLEQSDIEKITEFLAAPLRSAA